MLVFLSIACACSPPRVQCWTVQDEQKGRSDHARDRLRHHPLEGSPPMHHRTNEGGSRGERPRPQGEQRGGREETRDGRLRSSTGRTRTHGVPTAAPAASEWRRRVGFAPSRRVSFASLSTSGPSLNIISFLPHGSSPRFPQFLFLSCVIHLRAVTVVVINVFLASSSSSFPSLLGLPGI